MSGDDKDPRDRSAQEKVAVIADPWATSAGNGLLCTLKKGRRNADARRSAKGSFSAAVVIRFP
jgi:hypothetical protein